MNCEGRWSACDLILDVERNNSIIGTRSEVLLKKDWLRRALKFSKNYFKGDLKKTVYCLKDIHLFHKWEIINRQFKLVNFAEILGEPEYHDIVKFGAAACSGGQCEITRI